MNAEEPFSRPIAGEEFTVSLINVTGQQVRAVSVGSRQDERRHAHYIRRQPRRYELLDGLAGRD